MSSTGFLNKEDTIMPKAGIAFLVCLFGFLAFGIYYVLYSKGEVGGAKQEVVFITFPEKVRVIESTSLDKIDLDSAKKYYQGLFLNQNIRHVRDVAERDLHLWKRGNHIAKDISIEDVDAPNYVVHYVYSVIDPVTKGTAKDPLSGKNIVGLDWIVTLTFDGDKAEGKVSSVDIATNLLTE